MQLNSGCFFEIIKYSIIGLLLNIRPLLLLKFEVFNLHYVASDDEYKYS